MDFTSPTGPVSLDIARVTIAGWTGRDAAAVQHHIDELAALGIAPPSQVPLYYRVSANLLTHAATIAVLGAGSSGEAEPLLLRAGGKTWLGLGSDHTDRELEAHSVAYSKQACAKPVAAEVWDLDEVTPHLDDLVLRSWIEDGDDWLPYQEGTLASIRPLAELADGAGLADGDALFCGTLPAIGGVRASAGFRMALEDQVLGRRIETTYRSEPLPVVS